MAAVDKKISELTRLTIAASGDDFVVVDYSETNIDIRTKRISLSNLMGSPGPIGANNPSSIDATSIVVLNAVDEYGLDVTANSRITGDLYIRGNLLVDGTTFVVVNQELTTSDNIATLNQGESGAGVTLGQAGLLIDRGTETNYHIIFDESDDRFKVGLVGSEKLVLTGQAGNESLSLGDSTSIVVFATAEDDTNYSVTWSLVYEGGSTPSIYSGTVFDKTTTGFSVIFSGPMDTNDYVLSWIITR